MNKELPLGKSMPYWKTSKSGPEEWLDKVEALLEKAGGEVHSRAVLKQGAQQMIMMGFTLGNEPFKILWPALPVEDKKDNLAAIRQAATMIYHDVKAKVVNLPIFGPQVVFANWLMVDGKTIAELGPQGLHDGFKMLNPHNPSSNG